MKKIYKSMAISLMTVFSGMSAMAQWTQSVPGVSVRNQELTRNAKLMTVSMELDLSELELKSNGAAVFVPVIVNGTDSVRLPAVGVYGRTRWYQSLRSGKPLGDPGESSYVYSNRPSALEYCRNIPYEEWMNGASLILARHDFGCCSELTARYSDALGAYSEETTISFMPQFHYVHPVAEAVKSRALSGRAYIDFPVNRTELHPNFRNNSAELAKIIATIDSVRNDGDMTVTSLVIKGTASPEGSYDNNVRLAKGRTEALKKYVSDLYHFDTDFIVTDYVPEDWEGLREYVANSTLPHKKEILQVIDDPALDIDIKDKRIQARYGEEYHFLLDNVYPTLRRSEYRIEYSVRSYNDVATIREIMAGAPQKLSLSEMYLLAQTLEPGSDEYNEIFETAVRLFPNDETANLNAANAALSRRDLPRAERYLAKAGDSAEAIYARGVLAGMQGNKDKAGTLIRQAGAMGISDTEAAMELLNKTIK